MRLRHTAAIATLLVVSALCVLGFTYADIRNPDPRDEGTIIQIDRSVS